MKSTLSLLGLAALLCGAPAISHGEEGKGKAEKAPGKADKAPEQTEKANAAAPKVFPGPQKVGTKATCPVTGDELTIAKNTQHAEYKGSYVYFCCPSCKRVFDKDPEKYVKD
ncbi:MAG: YHS domain-containing protein [Polyangia bacterium]|jgi:YHS domain-containing protein